MVCAAGRANRGPDMAESGTTEGRRALWSHIRAILIIGAVLIVGGFWVSTRVRDRDVDAAEDIVRKASETPSSLRFVRGQVVIEDGEWRLVYTEFDEQNTFGAMIRRSGCVVFQWSSDSTYRWNSFPSPVLPCDIDLQGKDYLRSLIEGQKEFILRKDKS
jgi:hypothetical protein